MAHHVPGSTAASSRGRTAPASSRAASGGGGPSKAMKRPSLVTSLACTGRDSGAAQARHAHLKARVLLGARRGGLQRQRRLGNVALGLDERELEVAGAREPVLRAPGDGLHDDQREHLGDARVQGVRQGRAGLLLLEAHLAQAASAEGQASGEQPVADDAQRVHVHARVRGGGHPLLGRHVRGRAQDNARGNLVLREARGQDAGHAEVEHLHLPLAVLVAREEEVVRLEIAVHHAAVMRGLEPLEHLDEQGHDFGGRERHGHVRQGLAVHVLHEEAGQVGGAGAHIEHAGDVAVDDAAGGLGLDDRSASAPPDWPPDAGEAASRRTACRWPDARRDTRSQWLPRPACAPG